MSDTNTQPESRADLKPCPFCGSDPITEPHEEFYTVTCSQDACVLGNMAISKAAWNTRAARASSPAVPCPNCEFVPYDPAIFDECGGVRLDLLKPDADAIHRDALTKHKHYWPDPYTRCECGELPSYRSTSLELRLRWLADSKGDER